MSMYIFKCKSILVKFLEGLLFVLSLIIPNKKGLVVFSMSRGRYWGNSRDLFEYMVENAAPSLHVVWLADPNLPVKKIPREFRSRFVPRHSFSGWLLCARCQVVVISHGFSDFGLLQEVAKRKKVVMLWHAITTKNCGLLDEKLDDASKQKYRLNETNYYDWLITSSDIDRYYSASFTGMSVNQIAVTGLPRNDRLFDDNLKETQASEWFTILYAPTFRDYPIDDGSLFFPFSNNTEEIAKWASQSCIRFLLRPHPNDKKSVVHVKKLQSAYPALFLDKGVENVPDVTDLLLASNGIITDYSSIYMDGMALDLPVIFVDFDRERYIEARGLAYDYDLITPGPKVRTWPDFMHACESIAVGNVEWAEHRKFLRKMFFKYQDANACSRVSELIGQIVDC